MAPVVAAVAGAAVSSVVSGALSAVTWGLVANAAGAVAGGLVASALTPKPKTPDLSSSVIAQQESGVLINLTSSISPIPLIYGTRRVGGPYFLQEITGANNQYMVLGITISEGPIDGFGTLYLDDREAATWSGGVWTVNSTFSSRLSVTSGLGALDQAVDATLQGWMGSARWTADHRGRGVAWVAVRCEWDESLYATGKPVVTVDVRGRTLYDPRDASTAFKNNAALAVRDYLTNALYGRGIAQASNDDDATVVAANYCDQTVSIPGGGTQARYTCDGVVDVDQTTLDNTRALLSACRGMLVYSGGLYKLVIDKPETPAFTFDEDNIVGAWRISLPRKRARANRVKARFFDPDRNWQPNFAIQDSAAYLVADNNTTLEQELDLPFTANLYRAQHITQMALKQSRQGIGCVFTATIDGTRCEVGDVVYITHTTPGWVEKPFRVMEIELQSNDEVRVVAAEYDSSIYTLDDLDAAPAVPDTNLPDPYTATAPGVPTLASGTDHLITAGDGSIISRIHVSWSAPADAYVVGGGRIEIQYKKSSASEWSSAPPVFGSETVAYISPVEDGVSYDVRIRSRNAAGAPSSWVDASPHVVVGKTEPPPDIPALVRQGGTAVWTYPDPPVDFAGFRVRVLSGRSRNWLQGADWPAQDAIVREQRIDLALLGSGVQTLMVRAVDTSGNLSDGVASLIMGLGEAAPANIIETYDDAAAGFVGTKSNCSVVAGELVADDYGTLYLPDGGALYLPDPSSLYLPTQYKQATYTISYLPDVADVPADLLIDMVADGEGWQIEYRRPGGEGLYLDRDDAQYLPVGSDLYLADGATTWNRWPGSLPVLREVIEVRITLMSGVRRGEISALSLSLDVPDIAESFSGLVLSSSGTRIPITKTYREIDYIGSITIADGSDAVVIQVVDRSPVSGPLLQGYDGAGNPASATIDIDNMRGH